MPNSTDQTRESIAAAAEASRLAHSPAAIRRDIDALPAGKSAIITWPDGSTIGVVRRAVSGATFLDFGPDASLLIRYASGAPVDGIRAVHPIPDVAPAPLSLVTS